MRLLGHGVGAVLTVRAVECVKLGAEYTTAQGPQGVAPVAWISQRFQEHIDRICMRQGLWITRPVVRRPVQFLPVSGIVIYWPLVKPGLGEERRREVFIRYWLEVRLRSVGAGCVIIGKSLGIQLLDHAEAAKLALRPIPVTVVVAILGRELAVGYLVDHLDSRHYLHR